MMTWQEAVDRFTVQHPAADRDAFIKHMQELERCGELTPEAAAELHRRLEEEAVRAWAVVEHVHIAGLTQVFQRLVEEGMDPKEARAELIRRLKEALPKEKL
jgi:hypothetical protein